jgi:hypothetical protein
MNFTAGLIFALSAVLGSSTPASAASVVTPPVPQPQTAEQYVRAYFADEPVMIEVARCESTFQQFDKDGSVHRGVVNDKDIGIMQINEHYHAETADKLGLDIYTLQGNVAYAQYLYDKEGTAPWSSSEACWGKTAAAKAVKTAKSADLAAANNI